MVILVLGLFAAPLAAGAEQSGKVFRIGLLSNVSPTHPEGARLWGALIHGLRDLGYVEGQNISGRWGYSFKRKRCERLTTSRGHLRP